MLQSGVLKRSVAGVVIATLFAGAMSFPGGMGFGAGPAMAQVPVDAASDRRMGDFVYFKAFGEPKLPFDDLEDAGAVRADSDDYFRSELATCEIEKPTCNPDTVYELADRFCEALEFHEAATWRVSKDDDELTLHWVICGLKK